MPHATPNAQVHHDRCGEVGSIHVKRARRTSASPHCHFKSTITLPNPIARCHRKTVRLSPSFVAPPPLLLPSSFLLPVMNEATPLICRDSTTFYKHTHTKFRSFTSVSFYKIYAYFIYKLGRDQGRYTCRGVIGRTMADSPIQTKRSPNPHAGVHERDGNIEIPSSATQLETRQQLQAKRVLGNHTGEGMWGPEARFFRDFLGTLRNDQATKIFTELRARGSTKELALSCHTYSP